MYTRLATRLQIAKLSNSQPNRSELLELKQNVLPAVQATEPSPEQDLCDLLAVTPRSGQQAQEQSAPQVFAAVNHLK
jgi:hypothetical protein